ncbi:MAG: DUF2917 domain-containing protein [Rhodoferax sp.]|nr:DUF2917 domain-containing protein [Rhodoferax sp.]
MTAPVANPVLSDLSPDQAVIVAPLALGKGQTIAWRAPAAGVLRVTSGRLWVTLDVVPRSPLHDMGDHMVVLGHDLRLRAGQRVVIEAWPHAGESQTRLQWVAESPTRMALCWQTGVAEPVRDLVQGLGLAVRASGRLLTGLMGYAGLFAAGRGRVLSGLESNAP